MRFYQLIVPDDPKPQWFGTKGEYNKAYSASKREGYTPSLHSGPVEVPTDKAGLLKFLNTGEVE